MSDLSVSALAQTCGTCANGTRRDNGFIRCVFVPRHTSMGDTASCAVKPSAWVPISPEKVAQRLAQEGIQRAVDAADRAIEGWSDLALTYIRAYSTRNKGKEFIGYELVQQSIDDGVIQPPNAKAWGSPIQRAARKGYIVNTRTTRPDPNRHGNPVPVWVAVGE